MATYGEALTAQLAALGVSRNALARALGHAGPGTVSRWASGQAVPTPLTKARISAAMAFAASDCERRDRARAAYRAALDAPTEPQPEIIGPDTHEDAPGGLIRDGEVSTDTPRRVNVWGYET